MIGLPYNDLRCLGSITEVIAEMVKHADPLLVELATTHRTTEGLAAWIRTLPQRDDDGVTGDGPKVEACEPPQRLRIPAPDPNCVERAALYVAVAELIDPQPVRQLATVNTPMGLHTFPVENGAPIILDPRVPRNCLDCGVALTGPGPVEIDTHDAIEWSARLAEDGAGETNHRNGASRVRRARNAVIRLVDEGVAPAPSEVESMGWMFALAEQAAHRYGARALALVRTTALAIAEILDEVLARTERKALAHAEHTERKERAHAERNLALEFDGMRIEAPKWISALGDVAARVGMDVGVAALKSQLGALGIGADILPLVESELNRQGLTLGPLAHPPRLPTFATFSTIRPRKKAA